jgi:hypothetical protein
MQMQILESARILVGAVVTVPASLCCFRSKRLGEVEEAPFALALLHAVCHRLIEAENRRLMIVTSFHTCSQELR